MRWIEIQQRIEEGKLANLATAGMMGIAAMGTPSTPATAAPVSHSQQQEMFNPQAQKQVFQKVAKIMGITLESGTPAPEVFWTKDISDVKAKKHFKGCDHCVLEKKSMSVYAFAFNEIWLSYDAGIDVLAHEYTHYFQMVYQKMYDPNKEYMYDIQMEMETEAVSIQRKFK